MRYWITMTRSRSQGLVVEKGEAYEVDKVELDSSPEPLYRLRVIDKWIRGRHGFKACGQTRLLTKSQLEELFTYLPPEVSKRSAVFYEWIQAIRNYQESSEVSNVGISPNLIVDDIYQTSSETLPSAVLIRQPGLFSGPLSLPNLQRGKHLIWAKRNMSDEYHNQDLLTSLSHEFGHIEQTRNLSGKEVKDYKSKSVPAFEAEAWKNAYSGLASTGSLAHPEDRKRFRQRARAALQSHIDAGKRKKDRGSPESQSQAKDLEAEAFRAGFGRRSREVSSPWDHWDD